MTKIKISAGFSGKIPTGSFQNSAPSFMAEVEFDSNLSDLDLLQEINATQKQLHEISYQNFRIVADAARIEKVKNDLKGFRFYKTAIGEYPSVTTIIDPDFKAWCSEEELKIATAEGNICHARAAHFIKTGEWIDPKKLEGVASDLIICKGRFMDSWDFPAFLKKYPLTEMKNGPMEDEPPLVNDEHKYAGRHDGVGMYPLMGEKDAKVVSTIFDFKRTPDKDKNFIQMSAYAKCLDGIQQMMVIPANPDNAQGYSKPIISTAIDKYFEVFLDKREQFEVTYGV